MSEQLGTMREWERQGLIPEPWTPVKVEAPELEDAKELWEQMQQEQQLVDEPVPEEHPADGQQQQAGHQIQTAQPNSSQPLNEDTIHQDDDLEMETQVQKFQQKIKSSVAKDIKKLLMSSKAYVQHYSKPPVISQQHVQQLAAPKASLMHPDTVLAKHLGDPIEYAKVKAVQLQQKREAHEAAQATRQAEAAESAAKLQVYQQRKQQMEQRKVVLKEQQAQEQQEYGRQLAQYVSERAARELEEYKAKQQAAKQKAAVLHQKLKASSFSFT